MNLPLADRLALEEIAAQLAHAWNAGDAAGFAALFAPDGEQVNIFGTQLRGRHEIEQRHEHIFATVFWGSRNALRVVDARLAGTYVMLARVSSVVDVPQGPLQGQLQTIASMVLLRSSRQWEIVLFHNTRVASEETA